MLLGERIRQLRDKKRWSQEQLIIQVRRVSPDSKLARETISRLENGRNAPDMWVIETLCQVFGVTLSEFFAGVDLSDATQTTVIEVDEEATLDPEVAELAARINDLPDELRVRVVGFVDGALGVIEEQVAAGPILSDWQREMLGYFDELNEENQAVALARLRELLAAYEPSAERKGARGAA